MSGAGVRFAEVMTGHVAFGETDAARGAVAGREAGNRVTLRLTIAIDDLARFAADPDRAGAIAGEVECEALGGRLPIERGVFNLLVGGDGTDGAGPKRMLYRIFVRDGVGHPVTLVGEKRVGPPGLRVWSDTTTLFTRLLRGHVERGGDAAAEVVAAGVVRLRPLAFLRQLATFRAGGRSTAARVGAIARFDALFARRLWLAYGPPTIRRIARRRPGDGGDGER